MIDKTETTQPRGVTLLLVMLILSIVSSVALAVTFLIVRQFEQGTDVRKAIEAQDIADTGVEKILYEVKSARSGSANVFVNGLKTRYVCDDPANQGILDNGEFCVDQEASFEYETELQTSLKENEIVTLDLYDPSDPSGAEVTAIQLSGSADTDAWIEVSWVGWTVKNGSFSYIASTTKDYFRASEINPSNPSSPPSKKIIFKKTYDTTSGSSVYYLNNPFVTGTADVGQCTSDPLESAGCFATTNTTPINYIVRIKALFGDVPDLGVTAYANCIADEGCTNPTSVALPARVAVKVIGRTDKVLQAIQLSIPWRYSLAGLYDYALLSESSLSKEVSVNPGFYSTGTIQAEQGISTASYSTSAIPNTDPDVPFQCVNAPTLCPGWTTVNKNSVLNAATKNVRCQLEPDLDASGGATCGFDDGDGRMTYSLESYDLGEAQPSGVVSTRKAYYLNYRVRVTSQSTDEAMSVYACDSDDTCTNLEGSNIDEASTLYGASNSPAYLNRGADGWLTCSSLMYLSSDDTLQFRANSNSAELTPRLDWFNISTIAFVGQNSCTFAPWTYSADSYTFEVEDGLTVGQTCVGSACNSQIGWFGINRLAFNGTVSGSYAFDCENLVEPGVCSMTSKNNNLGENEVGFTYPLNYYNASLGAYSPKIAEGDYYVTVNAPLLRLFPGTANQNDNLIFDIGNFNENGGDYQIYSSSYLPNINYLNMYRAQGPFGTTVDTSINCVIPKHMRVLSGNAASISVSDSNSTGGLPTLTIDSFTISHSYPKDSSGNNLPLCTMLSGTPSAQFVQPLTGQYFAPIISLGYSNYIKVNAEAAQGSTDIDHVEVHAKNQTTNVDTLLGVEGGINPFQFEWPHDASWNPTLADGLYSFTAVAVDANGLATYPPTTVTNVTIDTVKPNVSAIHPFVQEGDGDVTTTVTATDSNGIAYAYVYSEGENRVIAYCSPASGTYPVSLTCNVHFTPTALPWDQQQFQVAAVDRAGNTQTVFYYADTVAPIVDPFTVTQISNVGGTITATATITATDTNPAGTPSIKRIRLYSAAEGAFVGTGCEYSTPYSPSQTCTITFTTTFPLMTNSFNGVAEDLTGHSGSRTYDPDTNTPTACSTLPACPEFTANGISVNSKLTFSGTITMRVTARDTESGLDYVKMLTYKTVGGIRIYTDIGTCEYNGETSLQTCVISWNANTTTWPTGADYSIELRVKDIRGRMISPSWGPKTIN